MTFKDKSGKELKKGDYVVYGHALGRCAGLRYGKVLDIVKSKPDYMGKTFIKLKVQGLDDDWNGSYINTLPKPGLLQFSDRVLKIEESQMPASYLAILA